MYLTIYETVPSCLDPCELFLAVWIPVNCLDPYELYLAVWIPVNSLDPCELSGSL